MDINNKEDLEKLYNFTFNISGDCPDEILNTKYNACSSENTESTNCVLCWRKALNQRIKQLEEVKG